MTGFREYAGLPPSQGQAPAQGQQYGDFLLQLMPAMMQQAQTMRQPPAPDPALMAGTHPSSPLGLPPAQAQPVQQQLPPPTMAPAPMPVAPAAPAAGGYQRGAYLELMRRGMGQ